MEQVTCVLDLYCLSIGDMCLEEFNVAVTDNCAFINFPVKHKRDR